MLRSVAEGNVCEATAAVSAANVRTVIMSAEAPPSGEGPIIFDRSEGDEGDSASNGRSAASISSLLQRMLALDYTPPPLAPLRSPDQILYTSEWSWTGPLDRFELVKSLFRCGGDPLDDDAVEAAVRALESAETAMSSQLWSTAAASLLNVINMHPNCTIAMYRAALCILASDGDCYLPDVPNKAIRVISLLRSCAKLECPGNVGLKHNIDLILCILAGTEPPEHCFDWRSPKSHGDITALVQIVMSRPSFKHSLACEQRLRRFGK